MTDSVVDTGNSIIPVANVVPSKYANDEAFASISSGGGFLPRIMLMNATSELVKDEKILQGRYALVRSKNSFEDLTKEVIILPLAWRPKALEIAKDGVLSIYDPKSPEFARISKKSEVPNSQAMFGPEFLVWIPAHKCFATYYMASKTARRSSGEVRALIGHAVLLRATQIKSKNNSWYGPIVAPSSSPMTDLPNPEEATLRMNDFNNPPEKAVDVAEESGRAQ